MTEKCSLKSGVLRRPAPHLQFTRFSHYVRVRNDVAILDVVDRNPNALIDVLGKLPYRGIATLGLHDAAGMIGAGAGPFGIEPRRH